MGKPGKKLKKIFLILGITGAVYGGFKYLLPLVVPFLCAYLAAMWMGPSVRYFERRLTIRLGGKERRIPAAWSFFLWEQSWAGFFILGAAGFWPRPGFSWSVFRNGFLRPTGSLQACF